MNRFQKSLLYLTTFCALNFNSFANNPTNIATIPALTTAQTEIEITPNLKLEVQAEPKEGKSEPRSLEEHFGVFRNEFHKETQRRSQRLKDIEEWVLLNKIPTHHIANDSGFYYLTENERDKLRDYGLDLLKDTGKETINEIGWTNYLEDLARSLISYGFSAKGERANGKTYSSAELDEEERLERRELNEETTKLSTRLKQWGKKYEFSSRVKLRGVGLTAEDTFDKVQYECSLKHFEIFGVPFYKADARLRGDGDARVRLTKIHEPGLYSRITLDSEKISRGIDSLTLSLSKDNPSSNFKFGIYAQQNFKENETRCGVRLIKRF